jgi:KDO2-lipid IV(A) lauroyltransferase
MAAGIAEHPQDWHMLQRLWLAEESTADKAVRSGEEGAAAAAPGVRQPERNEPTASDAVGG